MAVAVAWSRYSALLRSHPVSTKSVTSAVIAAFADVGLGLHDASSKKAADNRSIDNKPSWNWSRTGVVTSMGLVYSGPLNHFWNNLLERVVLIRLRWMSVATKCFLEQVVFAPIAIGGYISVRGAFEGKDHFQIAEKLELRWGDAWLSALQFWPAANAISFAFVPTMYRALYGSLCAVFWNARLSALSADKPVFEAPESERSSIASPASEPVIENDAARRSWSTRYRLSPGICLDTHTLQSVFSENSVRGSIVPRGSMSSSSSRNVRQEHNENSWDSATAAFNESAEDTSEIQDGCGGTQQLQYEDATDLADEGEGDGATSSVRAISSFRCCRLAQQMREETSCINEEECQVGYCGGLLSYSLWPHHCGQYFVQHQAL